MRLLFVHHSVGRHIIHEGGLREKLASVNPDIELWDHDYNAIGMSDGDGRPSPEHTLPVPNDDTDPPGIEQFLRSMADEPEFAEKLSHFDGLVFKSCYPNSDIQSAAALATLREIYERVAQLSEEVQPQVVLVTSPPLVAERTTRGNAGRARDLAHWLLSTLPNRGVPVIDLFGTLAAPDGFLSGTLRLSYRKPWPLDSHPNGRGSQAGASLLATQLSSVFTP